MKIFKFLINFLLLFTFLSHLAVAQVIYTVKRGDSLLKIAKKFNVTATDIIVANRLKPPYIIYSGQKLKIPVDENSYIVKRGDTIEKIAKRFGVSTKELIKLNRLRKPYRIYPGQKLKIPVKKGSTGKARSKFKKKTEIITYRVRKGDSVKKIAKKFGVSEKEIIKLNRLRRPYRIYVGQKLKIRVSKKIYSRKVQTKSQNSNKTSVPKYSMLRKVPIYKYYRVRPGDSIGKIAKKFGVSVKSIIRINRLKKPYIIRPGQRLKILVGYKDRLALNRPIEFKMPLDGQIDTTVREKGYKGIFIIAPPGEPVRASEVGIVKFAGKDDRLLKKYGNVVILEHPQGYTTIYASLGKINVKPGQLVHRGEIIGTSGVSGEWGRSGLYFEISRIHNKKAYPLNPLEVLR